MNFRFSLAVLGLVAAVVAPSTQAAEICNLFAINSTCTFTTDTSGGTAIYTNPDNTDNVGSGLIAPFLGTQVGGNGGVEVGVNTDQTAVNKLPLDSKRDNANTFTTTLQLNQLGVVTIGSTDYFDFFLDINEPKSSEARFLSIDRLAIFGQTGATPGALVDLNNTNVTSLDAVDCTVVLLGCSPDLFPNLSLVYRLGIGNDLLLDYELFSGSGNGYDMQLLLPTTLFAPLAPDSRIVFAVQYGGSDFAGAAAQDGFEEWAALRGNGPPPPPPPPLPEPGTLALLGIGLAGLAFRRMRK